MQPLALSAPTLFLAASLLCCGTPAGKDSAQAAGQPRALFNGSDFTNWDRYLGQPSDSDAPLGLANDPRGVYSVVTRDGEPAIRISGEVWGSLISSQEFCDFDLQVQFQWGSAVWPPLNVVDSGIMFLSTGPLGAVNAGGNALSDPIGSGAFEVAMEYQLAPGDTGTLYNLGPIAFETLSHTTGPELPGAWNQVEIIHRAGATTTLLNAQEVSRVSGFELDWPDQAARALTCGKLQLQSEGAEVYFRHVDLVALP